MKSRKRLLPGARWSAVNQLLDYFPATPGTLVSPFFSGGYLELALASRGWRVLGYSGSESLVDFWQQALTNPHRLADEAAKHLTADRLQAEGDRLPTALQRAAAHYARAACSGTADQRLMAARIERLRRFAAPNVWVARADFRESIGGNRNGLLFCDPQHRTAHRRYRGDLQAVDHEGLADLLQNRQRWVLCCEDGPGTRYLYGGRRIVPLVRSNDIVVVSDDLTAPSALCAEQLHDPMHEALEEVRREMTAAAA